MCKKILLIHIPKTAGISIMKNNKIPIKSYGHEFAKNISNIDDFTSVAFIRNPYDRFVSSYYFYKTLYKGVRGIKREISQYNNFRKFCLFFNDFKYKDDLQFINQKEFIINADGDIIVDYVGEYENLVSDWKEICKLTNNQYSELPKLNKSNHPNYTELYDEETYNIVYDLFKEDFNFFNFKK